MTDMPLRAATSPQCQLSPPKDPGEEMGSQCPQSLCAVPPHPACACVSHPLVNCLQTLVSLRLVPPVGTRIPMSPEALPWKGHVDLEIQVPSLWPSVCTQHACGRKREELGGRFQMKAPGRMRCEDIRPTGAHSLRRVKPRQPTRRQRRQRRSGPRARRPSSARLSRSGSAGWQVSRVQLRPPRWSALLNYL